MGGARKRKAPTAFAEARGAAETLGRGIDETNVAREMVFQGHNGRQAMGRGLRLLLDALARFGVRRTTKGWTACCPAHEDKHPSLDLIEGDAGKPVLHCRAGCTADAVIGALGLSWRDLLRQQDPDLPPDREPDLLRDQETIALPRMVQHDRRAGSASKTTFYEICNRAGDLVAKHVRIDFPPGSEKPKAYRWQLPSGEWTLDGMKPNDLPLFGAELLDGEDGPVYLCEGEKAALALGSLGVLALGTVTGAGATPSARVLEILKGYDVVPWPDHDEVGRKHMRRISELLRGVARSVRTIRWGTRDGDDAADFVAGGGTREDLERLLQTASDPANGAKSCDDNCTAGCSEEPARPKDPGLRSYSLDELHQAKFPPRRPLLTRLGIPVFRSGDLAEVYAPRGVGKTLFLQTLALVAAGGGDALGFEAPAPCNVLVIDGEMASEMLQDRFRLLSESLGVQPGAGLRIIAADWQTDPMARIDTPEGQAGIAEAVSWGDLIIVDNRSCLFDSEAEKDASAWTPAADLLFSLRRQGKAVILAHHTNRQGGARGHSKPEDAMDILIKLTRPEGYSQDQGSRFLVEWEKSRGVFGAAVAPFSAWLKNGVWTVESAHDSIADSVERKLLDYLRLVEGVNERPKTASAAVKGAGLQKAKGLKAFKKLQNEGRILDRDGYVAA